MRFTRSLALAALLAAASLGTPAMAECVYPKTPASAPDGSTATKEEMLATKVAIDKYQSEVNQYLECLDKEADAKIAEAADKADVVKQIKQVRDKKHNAALDELTARADEFNQQVRAFNKNKNKS
jgi:hypothetical protein